MKKLLFTLAFCAAGFIASAQSDKQSETSVTTGGQTVSAPAEGSKKSCSDKSAACCSDKSKASAEGTGTSTGAKASSCCSSGKKAQGACHGAKAEGKTEEAPAPQN